MSGVGKMGLSGQEPITQIHWLTLYSLTNNFWAMLLILLLPLEMAVAVLWTAHGPTIYLHEEEESEKKPCVKFIFT